MSCQFAPLNSEALLHISGPDTLTFLQGQTSCDTRELSPERALPGIYCTPKGRVVCDFLACELGEDHFALRLRRTIRPSSAAAFGKYIIFSKATLEDKRDDWTVIGIWGDAARSVLSDLFGAVPTKRYSTTGGEGFLLVQVDDAGKSYECYLREDRTASITSRLRSDAQESDEAHWQCDQIREGVVRITESLVEDFVPQTLNYDLTGHISFKKGCYTGQEVVARLHYRGTPKRRTFLGTVPTSTLCKPGSLVYISNSDKAVGSIVNCAKSINTYYLLLEAVTAEVPQGLHIDSKQGTDVQLEKLPYVTSSEQDSAQ